MFSIIGIIIIMMCGIVGIVFMTINLVHLNLPTPETKIVYRYIPKTFQEEQCEQPFASDVFKTMFTQNTPWIDSIMDYDRRKTEAVNKYYISQI